MAKQRPGYITERDGFRLEWFSRRSEVECNVYDEAGTLVSELGYPTPRQLGMGFAELCEEFTAEAVGMARREAAKRA